MRKLWLTLLTIPLLLLSACGGNEQVTLEELQKQGYVTVGFAGENPYAYKDENGKLTGEAVEIARVILERLGIDEMKGELTEFSGLIAGLNAKRFDMITAGMFINPERCESVNFADPEYSIGEGLAVKAGNPLGLKSYADIAANKDAKVAVMAGAVEIGYLEASGVPEDQMVFVNNQDDAISALQSDRADAMTMTGPALQSRLDASGDSNLERVMDFEQPTVDGASVRGYGASAFRKADTELRDAFNAELDKMKESGELLEILQQFGFTEQELPGDMTAQQLCEA
ncbi:ectoine/hydroxyectoine ABC transporter substrate-binding protein EhuB [Paenibacillus sp. J5C_2022]|uniref:ectoine/hydroxyectoine ABC transporter substrate-binding protein EhuB n=1 Tax=Paenibacillus sp. J5C2022 TaxID=2977129 RepID=UPI0021D28319|nr:ectoine/hydroxyectoine ABC transporter substrate-binding protein EhuB [Paenibacillus sp. J5C2022]MCU6708137.1 ectoine/hydroxyectoine ABC transporter substrate-binding protein EhuB [Paenibacillus sp. J5C2022]